MNEQSRDTSDIEQNWDIVHTRYRTNTQQWQSNFLGFIVTFVKGVFDLNFDKRKIRKCHSPKSPFDRLTVFFYGLLYLIFFIWYAVYWNIQGVHGQMF